MTKDRCAALGGCSSQVRVTELFGRHVEADKASLETLSLPGTEDESDSYPDEPSHNRSVT